MTIEEAYSKLRYSIAEYQYYIDSINDNVKIITVLSTIAIIISLTAILFISYSFFMTKKQEKELKKTNKLLKEIIENLSKENAEETSEETKTEETVWKKPFHYYFS